jgi:hypothetical protein
MRPRHTWAAVAAAALTATCAARRAGAEPQTHAQPPLADACVAAFEGSQLSRRNGQLLKAQSELATCVQTSCLEAIQVACEKWLGEVERAIPTVVLEASVNGEDRTDVRVDLDGEVLRGTLDGKAIGVDPGPHTFRFHWGALPPVEKPIVVKEGEKLRVVSATFEEAPKPASQPLVPPAPAPASRPVPPLVYVLGGVAAAGAGAFLGFGLSGRADVDRYKGECAPRCSQDQVDGVQTKYLIANVSAVIAGAALVTGAVVYVIRPRVLGHFERLSFALRPTLTGAGASTTLDF